MTISQGASDRKRNPRMLEKMGFHSVKKKFFLFPFTEMDDLFLLIASWSTRVFEGLWLSSALCLLLVAASVEHTD